MTYSEFQMYAKTLIEMSQKLNDGWREQFCAQNETVYLVKTQRDVRRNHDSKTVEQKDKFLDKLDEFRSSGELPRGLEDGELQMRSSKSLDPMRDKPGLVPVEAVEHYNKYGNELYPNPTSETFCNEVEIDLEDDLASYVPDDLNTSSFTWEYHILYSSSYGVPVLYFNAWAASGALLTLDELWGILEFNVEDKWAALTQVEHPYLRQPFFQLHPCKTQHLIGMITNRVQDSQNFTCTENSSTNVNKLISWLSCIACYVHLNFPIDYGKCVTALGAEQTI